MKTLLPLLIPLGLLLLSCQSEISPAEPGEKNLSFIEYGPGDGIPVFYFHGFPGSHKDIMLFKGNELAEELNIRLIAIDRPGYGSSDPDVKMYLNFLSGAITSRFLSLTIDDILSCASS